MKSPLLEPEELLEQPNYTVDEAKYLSKLRVKLESARTARDGVLDEFDQMPFLTYWDTNEKLANTFVGVKKNKTDSNFQSGTVRNKLFTFLSSINRMNLSPDVLAFNQSQVLQADLGNAITEVLRKTEELENDDEKRVSRQLELMKQGTVFVEDIWRKSYKKEKKVTGKSDDPSKLKWTEEIREALARPNRTILDNRGVYLGSMTTFDMDDQPYIFTVDVIPYEQAKSIYGKLDRWKNVPRKLAQIAEDPTGINWRLTQVDADYVEVIKYQDRPNDEFQLVLNGVMMLPYGFPLSEVSCNGDYTIVKQVFKLIRHNFPYGKSLCMELRNQVGIYDELLRLAVLKTQKSFKPPYVNNTGQMLTSQVFMPGVISMGFDPRKLQRLDEHDAGGVSNGEVAVINMISQRIDESSVNKSYQGGEAPGSTLGEAQIAQQQSDMIVDLAMFTCSMLEKKLGEKRVPMVMKYYFDPIDKRFNDARKMLEDVYRVTNVEASIPGRGVGRSMVIPQVGNIPSGEDIYRQEEEESKAMAKPVRKYYIDPQLLKKSEYIWQVVVNPTPRRGDAQEKLMLNATITSAKNLFPDTFGEEYWQERFSEANSADRDRAFVKRQTQPQQPQVVPQQPQPGLPQRGMPQISAKTNRVNIT